MPCDVQSTDKDLTPQLPKPAAALRLHVSYVIYKRHIRPAQATVSALDVSSRCQVPECQGGSRIVWNAAACVPQEQRKPLC